MNNSLIVIAFIAVVVLLGFTVWLMLVLSYAKSAKNRLMSAWHESESNLLSFREHTMVLIRTAQEFGLASTVIAEIEELLNELENSLSVTETAMTANRYTVLKDRIAQLEQETVASGYVANSVAYKKAHEQHHQATIQLENGIKLLNQQVRKYNRSIGSIFVAPVGSLIGLKKATLFVADEDTIAESEISNIRL